MKNNDFDDNDGVGLVNDGNINEATTFGGPWTIKKLDILEKYLNAYTTALKSKSFNLMYIDAFAGSGKIAFPKDLIGDVTGFVSGSAERALRITNKPFDKLIFIESHNKRCLELDNLRKEYPKRKVTIENTDANSFLANINFNSKSWRGVLFLDPFATEVEWVTIEKISSFNALDTWILFPVSAIARMLPVSREPDEIGKAWGRRLTRIYGDNSWRDLYKNTSPDLFGKTGTEREYGVEGLLNIYKEKLSNQFGDRFLQYSKTLKNSRNSPLFEFLFCAGNPSGANLAKKIARDILKKL